MQHAEDCGMHQCTAKVCCAVNPVLPHHSTIVILVAAAVTLFGTAVDIIMAE